jgi:hypothetical protein
MWQRPGTDNINNWVDWTTEFSAEDAETCLSKFVTEEWALRRLYKHRLPDWDLDGYTVERREELRDSFDSPEFQKWNYLGDFLSASREVFQN